MVVGAHWDTVPHTPGYDDNGSGVAALLEVAATLVNAECHRNEHSVIFVLFDMEEPGCHGSLEFIRTFLAPKFLDRGIEIQGMFNLDTMLNFNDDSGSQTVPDNWDSLMPEAAENVRRMAKLILLQLDGLIKHFQAYQVTEIGATSLA